MLSMPFGGFYECWFAVLMIIRVGIVTYRIIKLSE